MPKHIYTIFLFSFLLACGPSAEEDYQVFKYTEFNNVTSLDPAFARSNNNMWVTNQIYDGLVKLDTALHVVPEVAKHWDISEDGLTYTFTLRDDVYFHRDTCFAQGRRRLLASDVVYSFQRIVDDAVASPGSWIFKGKIDEARPFEALDDTTFVLRLKRPFIPMLGILSMQYCNIVPREAVEHYGIHFRSHPVGSGPFRFKRWIENQSLFLNRNPDYYRSGMPYVDGVKVDFISDRKIAFLELKNGRIDYFSGLESSFINELLTRSGELQPAMAEQMQYIKAPYLNFEYLGINMDTEHALLSDRRVRQAMNYAIDRKTMLAVLRNNVGQPASGGVIPRGLPSHASGQGFGYSYDPERAESLLREAGLGESELEPIILKTNNDYLDLCTYVANQWQAVGLPVQIEVEESAVLRDAMRNGRVDFFRASWVADYPDGENYLCLFYSKNGAPPNYTRFADAQFDAWYEEAILERDGERRRALYRQMDSLVIAEAPVVFLFYDEKAQFTSPRVADLPTSAVNMLDLSTVRLDRVKQEGRGKEKAPTIR